MTDEIDSLLKLRELVVSDKQTAELNNEPEEMSIVDLDEWLKEIDTEIRSKQKHNPQIKWLKEKYFAKKTNELN